MTIESGDNDRARVRREQVLAAAAACFQRHGFHGASMAEISREAGMSVGHIYHYFANKEAIIAAIVARDQQQILDIDARIRTRDDWARGLLDHVPLGLSRALDGMRGALLLEVLAEAARNPGVAVLVQQADAEVRRQIGETLRVASGRGEAFTDAEGRTEVLSALFEGLQIRAVRNPGLDRAATARVMQRVMRALLEA